MKRTFLILACVGVAATLCAPAGAETYTVKLDNGATLESRYQPVLDPHDPGKLLMLTDQSNWISLPMSIVTSVTEQFETRGLGLRIDSNTVEVGYLPNDRPDPNAEPTAPQDPTERLIRALQGEPEEPYSVEQFVQPAEYGEPGEAGGIPIGFTRRNTPPLGRPFE